MNQNAKDLQECVATMRDGSKSFFAASRILPQRVRDPATALYAFCRITDDVADAVDAMIAGKAVDPAKTKSIGCSIKRKA